MVKISILYANNKDSKFDFSYYINVHMRMAVELLGSHRGFKGVSVERGLREVTYPAYIAMYHFLFDSTQDFLAAFTPNATELQGDIPDYTDIEPIIRFNEVLISR
jgi:uncharacterized protein (TIGR02118 family)